MAVDKNKAIIDYINTYPQIYSWIYFNAVIMFPGNTSILTDADLLIEEYIDGSQSRQYIFNVAFVHSYDTNTSDINVDAMAETNNFINWIEENDLNNVYPVWNDPISSISVLSQIPLMTIDTETSTAQYTLQCKIDYLKEERSE